MPQENEGLGEDDLIQATLYSISTGNIITPIAVTRIEMLDLQDVGDQSYILGHWDPEQHLVVDGEVKSRAAAS